MAIFKENLIIFLTKFCQISETDNDLQNSKQKRLEILFYKMSEDKSPIKAAEARAAEAEANMIKAAEYGKHILEKLKESEQVRSDLEQERHSLKLLMQSKESTEIAMQDEIAGNLTFR